jgi:cellulose synthase/poly-beta-1,6-N-acetylglucosamine synthase-like glycosyltransferase
VRVAIAYFSVTAIIFLACMGLFGVFVVTWGNPLSMAQFGLLVFFTFSFSLTFTKRLFSLFVRPFPIPKLENLQGDPRVAVLYTTMNDVVPQCLERIQQTYPADVYVLDDSTDPEKRGIVDRISSERGYVVVHREARLGYKAGAINDWLQEHGSKYDHFVLLDADSLIPQDWVQECLSYAEHPSNRNVAVFQGLINIWNLDGKFVKTLAPIHLISQDEWEKKMANYLDAVLFYGHNALLRTKPVVEVGGFPTEYVSEDFALAVRLADHGDHCRFVPLNTYEALPENVRGFVKRQNKWTRGAMEFFGFARGSKISWARKLILLEVPLGHVSYLCIMAAMFLAIYARNSSWTTALGFAHGLLASPLVFIWSIPLFRYTISLGIVSAIIVGLKLLQVRLHPILYWRFQILSRAIGAIMLPHEVKSILYYLFNRVKRFPVTPKDEPPLGWPDVARLAWMTIILTVGFLIGLGLVNPVGFFYNVGWLLPFGSAPLIIYYFSKPTRSHDSGLRLNSFLVTCLQGRANRAPSPRGGGRLEGSRGVPEDGKPRPTVQGPQ